jgi:uncharacterized membrane protein HdeD (DUF308 family)
MSSKEVAKSRNVLLQPMVLGIFGLVFGLFLLVGQEGAGRLVGLAVCLYLLIDGAIETVQGLASRGRTGTTVGFIRGIIGLVVAAALLILHLGLDVLSYNTGMNILAAGLIVYGALGLYAGFFERDSRPVRWAAIIINALLVVWGILILVAHARDALLLTWSAIILIAIGVVGIGYGWYTRDQEPEAPAPA